MCLKIRNVKKYMWEVNLNKKLIYEVKYSKGWGLDFAKKARIQNVLKTVVRNYGRGKLL